MKWKAEHPTFPPICLSKPLQILWAGDLPRVVPSQILRPQWCSPMRHTYSWRSHV
jgi:hypothetical protein